MREGFAGQYRTPSVIIEPGDKPDEVIEFALDIGALYFDDPDDDEVFVVEFPGMPGPECYTERALRSSLK